MVAAQQVDQAQQAVGRPQPQAAHPRPALRACRASRVSRTTRCHRVWAAAALLLQPIPTGGLVSHYGSPGLAQQTCQPMPRAAQTWSCCPLLTETCTKSALACSRERRCLTLGPGPRAGLATWQGGSRPWNTCALRDRLFLLLRHLSLVQRCAGGDAAAVGLSADHSPWLPQRHHEAPLPRHDSPCRGHRSLPPAGPWEAGGRVGPQRKTAPGAAPV